MDDSPTWSGPRDGAPRPTTTRSLKPTTSRPGQGQAPLNTETNQTAPLLPKHTIRRNGRQPYPEKLMGRNTKTRPAPTTTMSLKPRGVDAVKVKRRSPQTNQIAPLLQQERRRPSTPQLTTRSIKPRGVDPVKVRQYLKKTGEWPPVASS